jgi:hypothetical protein
MLKLNLEGRDLPTVPAEDSALLARAAEHWPDQGRWVVPVLMREEDAGSWVGRLIMGEHGTAIRVCYRREDGLAIAAE